MAVTNDNFRVEAGKHIDDRYLKAGVPYADVAEVNSTIVLSRRYKGLTVLIGVDEYWYKSGITDSDLIVKTAGAEVSAGNGVIIDEGVVKLGGTVDEITLVTLALNAGFYFTDGVNLILGASRSATGTGSVIQSVNAAGTQGLSISLDAGNDSFLIADSRSTPKGIMYFGDYTDGYETLSLIHKGYADAHLGGNTLNDLVKSPTSAEDGFVVAWNDANQEYELIAGGGGFASMMLTEDVTIDGYNTGDEVNYAVTFIGLSDFTVGTTGIVNIATEQGLNLASYSDNVYLLAASVVKLEGGAGIDIVGPILLNGVFGEAGQVVGSAGWETPSGGTSTSHLRFRFNSSLYTEDEHLFEGTLTEITDTLSDNLTGVTYEAKLDDGADTYEACADITALMTWITTNVTDPSDKYWIKAIANFGTSVGTAEVFFTYK